MHIHRFTNTAATTRPITLPHKPPGARQICVNPTSVLKS